MKISRLIGNILWFVLGGFLYGIAYFLTGLFWCFTFVGFPVGIQMFKLAKFTLWPFGKSVENTSVTGFKTILNLIWAILFGWEYALAAFLSGVACFLTFIGIPIAFQFFKLASFALLPLGRDFVSRR